MTNNKYCICINIKCRHDLILNKLYKIAQEFHEDGKDYYIIWLDNTVTRTFYKSRFRLIKNETLVKLLYD